MIQSVVMHLLMHNQTDCNQIHHQKPITTSGDPRFLTGSHKVVQSKIVNKGCTSKVDELIYMQQLTN